MESDASKQQLAKSSEVQHSRYDIQRAIVQVADQLTNNELVIPLQPTNPNHSGVVLNSEAQSMVAKDNDNDTNGLELNRSNVVIQPLTFTIGLPTPTETTDIEEYDHSQTESNGSQDQDEKNNSMYDVNSDPNAENTYPQIQSTSISGVSTPNPRSVTHRSYTVSFKVNVLDWYYSNGENKNKTAKNFNIDRKRIRDWLQNEQSLREDPMRSRVRKPSTGAPPQYKKIDEAVGEWYKEQQSRGVWIRNKDVRVKALELAPQFGFQDSFKASSNWITSWKKRYNVVLGQDSPQHKLSTSSRGNDGSSSASREAVVQGNSSVIGSNDFEEHLRLLEKVGAGLEKDITSTVGVDTSVAHEIQANILGGFASPLRLGVHHKDDPKAVESVSDQNQSSMLESGGNGLQDMDSDDDRPSQYEDQQLSPQNIITGSAIPVDNSFIQQKLREHEQWVSILEQILQNDMDSSKISQAKLVLQQLKFSIQQTTEKIEQPTQQQEEVLTNHVTVTPITLPSTASPSSSTRKRGRGRLSRQTKKSKIS